MRVLFYDHGSGSLGIQYLLAIVRQHGHVPLLHFDCSMSKDYLAKDLKLQRWLSFSVAEIAADILSQCPDVVCFSLTTHFFKQALELICELKAQSPDTCIICGGIHATLVPHHVLRHPEVDFMVRGEGELSFANLLSAIERHGVASTKALPREALPGVWNMDAGTLLERGLSPLTSNLDVLPFPDKTLHRQWNPQMTAVYTTLASRGCFYACTYCNSVTVKNMYNECDMSYYRVQSVSRIIDELKQAKELYHPHYVEFYDDVFGADIRWMREFAERYPREIGLPFGIESNPTTINDERVELLTQAGCVTMELGFQSANKVLRETVLNRKESAEGVHNLIRAATKRGIFVELDFIVNLPGEKPEHIDEMLDFIRSARPNLVNMSFLQFYPQTPIIARALECGQINEEEVRRIEEGDHLLAFRLPPRSRDATDYTILPTLVALATALPSGLSRILTSVARLPGVRRVVSASALQLLYAYRLSVAITHAKCYYMRWQVKRGVYNLWAVIMRKKRGQAFTEPLSAARGRND